MANNNTIQFGIIVPVPKVNEAAKADCSNGGDSLERNAHVPLEAESSSGGGASEISGLMQVGAESRRVGDVHDGVDEQYSVVDIMPCLIRACKDMGNRELIHGDNFDDASVMLVVQLYAGGLKGFRTYFQQTVCEGVLVPVPKVNEAAEADCSNGGNLLETNAHVPLEAESSSGGGASEISGLVQVGAESRRGGDVHDGVNEQDSVDSCSDIMPRLVRACKDMGNREMICGDNFDDASVMLVVQLYAGGLKGFRTHFQQTVCEEVLVPVPKVNEAAEADCSNGGNLLETNAHVPLEAESSSGGGASEISGLVQVGAESRRGGDVHAGVNEQDSVDSCSDIMPRLVRACQDMGNRELIHGDNFDYAAVILAVQVDDTRNAYYNSSTSYGEEYLSMLQTAEEKIVDQLKACQAPPSKKKRKKIRGEGTPQTNPDLEGLCKTVVCRMRFRKVPNAMIFYLYLLHLVGAILNVKAPLLQFLYANLPNIKCIILFLRNLKWVANILASLGLGVFLYSLISGRPIGEHASTPTSPHFIVGSLWFWTLVVMIFADGIIKKKWIRVRWLENFWSKQQNSPNHYISRCSIFAPHLLNWLVKLGSQIGSPLISANLALDVPLSQLNTYLLALIVLSLYSLGDVIRLDFAAVDILVAVIIGLLLTRRDASGKGYINWVTFSIASTSTLCRLLQPVFAFLYRWAKSDASFCSFFDSYFNIEERKTEKVDLGITSHVINIDDPLVSLEDKLYGLGLKIIPNTADGNCLYRALAYQSYGSEDSHLEIRHTIEAYIMGNPDHFLQFNVGAEYCKDVRTENVWGDFPSIVGYACAYRVIVKIFKDDNSLPICVDPSGLIGATTNSIYLSYHNGNHYNSVRLRDDPGTGPALNFTIKENGKKLKVQTPSRVDL